MIWIRNSVTIMEDMGILVDVADDGITAVEKMMQVLQENLEK